MAPAAAVDVFSTGARPPATNLITEDVRDGAENCLDAAWEYLDHLSPAQRAAADVVFLDDVRPGAEGVSGHVLIRQGSRFTDPVTGKVYASLRQFDPRDDYRPAGVVAGAAVHAILSAPPRSAARAAALESANVPAPVARMLVADTDPIAAADADYDNIWAWETQGGMVDGAHHIVLLLQEHAGDPAYLARIIERLQSDTYPGRFDRVVTAGLSYADDGQRALVAAFEAARAAGFITDLELGARATTGSQWQQLAGLLGVADTELGPFADVQAATEALRAAQQAASVADQRLAAQLERLGPALTDEERARYIAEFQALPEYAGLYAGVAAAEQELFELLAAQTDALAGAATDEAGARMVYEAASLLAHSEHAARLLDGPLQAFLDPATPAGAAMRQYYPDFETEVVGPAVVNGAAQIAALGGDVIEFYNRTARGFLGINLTQAGLNWDALRAANHAGRLEDIVAWLEGGNTVPGLSQALPPWLVRSILVGNMVAVAVGGATGIGTAANDEQLMRRISQMLGGVQGGLEIGAGWMEAMKLVSRGPLANAPLRMVQIAPAFGLLSSAALLYADGAAFREDREDWGKVVSMIGDAVSMFGAAVQLTGNPAGLVMFGIGMIINGVGEAISHFIHDGRDQAARREEALRLLEAAGIDREAGGALYDAAAERLGELVALGMTPADLRALGRACPSVLTLGTNNGLPLLGLEHLQDVTGYSGTQLAELLVATGEGATFVSVLLRDPALLYARDRGELLAALRQQASDPERAPMFEAAIAYLESH